MKIFTKKISLILIRNLLSILFFLIISVTVSSQNVSISPTGAVPANTSAGLDVNFTDKGLLIPHVALTGTSNANPLSIHIAGMVVYDTVTTADVTPGFYFNDGAKWVPCTPKTNAAGDMQYWNGTSWITIPVGHPGQFLQLNNSGIPAWTGAGYASITTTTISGITTTTASSGGVITTDGGNAITAYGVCWSTTTNPTIANSKTIDGSGIASFASSITGLTTGTTYYVRAYATNSSGTSYGNQISFTTP